MKNDINTLSSAVNVGLPDKRIIKLSEKQIESLKTVSEVALMVIALAGLVSVAAVAPNALKAVNLFLPKRRSDHRWSHEEKVRKVEDAFYYLKRSGMVQFKKSGTEWLVSLTDLGKQKAEKLNIKSLLVTKPKKWDKKWWLVAADIPTKDFRRGADLLRRKLKDMHFFPLQRTLWLYPFDPTKEIEFISQTFNIAHFVTVMKIDQLDIEDGKNAKVHFQLHKIL